MLEAYIMWKEGVNIVRVVAVSKGVINSFFILEEEARSITPEVRGSLLPVYGGRRLAVWAYIYTHSLYVYGLGDVLNEPRVEVMGRRVNP